MEHLDITLDFETCSLSANAAVLQLGAVAWNRQASNPFTLLNKDSIPINESKAETFNQSFDIRDQIFSGRDFDADTISWWKTNNKDVKAGILAMEPQATKDVLTNFTEWVKDLLDVTGAKSVCLWSQGTDFDIAILRSLTSQFNVELPKNIYKNFRDCRTYIQEVGSFLFLENPLESAVNPRAVYRAIEQRFGKYPTTAPVRGGSATTIPGSVRGGSATTLTHDALYDAVSSTWSTYQCLRAYWTMK